jgi:anti-anti-sigma factor
VTPQLTITLLEVSRPVRLQVKGEVDLVTCDQLDAALTEAPTQYGRVVLDLTETTFMSSVGLRVLYTHAAGLSAVLVTSASIIYRALSIAGLGVVIPIDLDNP